MLALSLLATLSCYVATNNDLLPSNTKTYSIYTTERGTVQHFAITHRRRHHPLLSMPIQPPPILLHTHTHLVHTCSVQNEPEDLFSVVPFVPSKYPSLSSSRFCFSHSCSFTFTVQCTLLSLPFLREFSKVRETRPLGCSAASPLLQVSPLFQFPLFLFVSVTLPPALSHACRIFLSFSYVFRNLYHMSSSFSSFLSRCSYCLGYNCVLTATCLFSASSCFLSYHL